MVLLKWRVFFNVCEEDLSHDIILFSACCRLFSIMALLLVISRAKRAIVQFMEKLWYNRFLSNCVFPNLIQCFFSMLCVTNMSAISLHPGI